MQSCCSMSWMSFWSDCKISRALNMLLWDHSIWLSHVHKTPLQMRACSLLTWQLFCINIISCSWKLKERICKVLTQRTPYPNTGMHQDSRVSIHKKGPVVGPTTKKNKLSFLIASSGIIHKWRHANLDFLWPLTKIATPPPSERDIIYEWHLYLALIRRRSS